MTALTEQDRAKRAKMLARYKQKSVCGDDQTSPKPEPVEVSDDRRDDEQLTSRVTPASDSTLRDATQTNSNDVDDATRDVLKKSQASPHSAARQRANQLAMAKKKLAASRKVATPVKTAYSSKTIVQRQASVTEKVKKLESARPAPGPLEKKVDEPYTPPRVVSKRAEMARKLAASRVTTLSPQPKMKKSEKPVVTNSAHAKWEVKNSVDVKSFAFASKSLVPDADMVKSKSGSSSFDKPRHTLPTETMDRFAANKTSATKSNQLARLRAASPAVVAAVAAAKAKPTKMGYSTSNKRRDDNCDTDEDESTFFDDDDFAQEAVIQRREQFRKKQEEKKNPKAVGDPSFLQPNNPPMSDQFGHSIPKNPVSMSDSVSDPSLPSMSLTSSRDTDAPNPSLEIKVNEGVPSPPPKTEGEKVSQDFEEGFGFSQEDFSHASWGLGPAFSTEIIASGDAEWSRPVNCSTEQKVVKSVECSASFEKDEKEAGLMESKSAEFAASFQVKVSKDEEEDGVIEGGDKENVNTIADAPREDVVSPSATASVQYIDFGVGKSRGGSVERNSINDEEEDLDKSIVSEETTASATEFDPLSMFGGSDDELQEMESSDDNAQTKVSWATHVQISGNSSSDQARSVSSSSQNLTRAEDGSNSISFPSLNSGSLMKPPKPAHQPPTHHSVKAPPPPAKNVVKPPPDSPSGTESLESWWQSRCASSQNNDINAAVQEALLNEASSVSKKSQADSLKNISGVSTLSSGITLVESKEQVPSNTINEDESCSIFSGISGIDEVAQQVTKNLLDTNIDSAKTEEEDIFSGVSVSNTNIFMQVDDVAMKSAMGGTSSGFTLQRANAESQSMMYANYQYTQSKVMNSLVDGMSTTSLSTQMLQTPNAQYMPESKESLSSLQENNYGVIELKNNEKSSPANSHTSDITSSVVFGCEPTPRRAHRNFGRDHERILETNESEEKDSIKSREASLTFKSEQPVESEVNKMNTASKSVSQVAPSTCDSTSQGSTFDQTRTTGTGMQDEYESQAPYFGLSGLRDQAKAAILSRFSCGLLNASSFALCTANGKKVICQTCFAL